MKKTLGSCLKVLHQEGGLIEGVLNKTGRTACISRMGAEGVPSTVGINISYLPVMRDGRGSAKLLEQEFKLSDRSLSVRLALAMARVMAHLTASISFLIELNRIFVIIYST